MQSPRWLIVASSALLLAALIIAAACGGGSKEEPSVSNPDEVVTATLPNPLPNPVIVGPAQVPGDTTTYTVQENDSLSAIATQFGVTVEAIMEANGITDPAALAVGQVLTIPGVSEEPPDVVAETPEPVPTSAPPAATEEPPPPSSGDVYIVQEGDIPETIAAQFGITADELMAANGITDPSSLQIGQELIIPEPQQ